MAEIIKIDEDTYRIVNSTEEIISLSELEQQLLDLKESNDKNWEIELWKNTLPEDKRNLVMSFPIIDTTYLENKINQLKNINN